MSSTALTAHSHRPRDIDAATVAVSGNTEAAEPVDIAAASPTGVTATRVMRRT